MLILSRTHVSMAAAFALTGLAALAAAPAHAQNLVKDGGFENAALGARPGTKGFTSCRPFDTKWAVTGTVSIDTDNAYVYAGDKSLYLNDGFGTDAISQNLATKAGQDYTLSFYADSDTLIPLTVTFGSREVGGGPLFVPDSGFPHGDDMRGKHRNDSDFTFYSYTVSATSPLTGLSFSAFNPACAGGTTLELDKISVVPAAVPEASTTISFGLLLFLGLGSALLACKKNIGKNTPPTA